MLRLSHVGLVDSFVHALGQSAVAYIKRDDGDESGDGDDDEGVHENGDDCYNALLVGVFHIGHSMCMRSGSHACFVGEQAALSALGERGDNAEGHTADGSLRVERALENQRERCRQLADVCDDDGKTADEVNDRHDGDKLLGDGCDARNAAEEDEAAYDDDCKAHDPGGNAESGVAGGCDGVRLDHAAHEAERQDDGDGEETCEEGSEFTCECGLDVVDRAAVYCAIGIDSTGLLRKDGFCVVGRHSKEGNEPHPENSARAADEDGAACADDITRADLRSNGGGQRLERAHAAFLLAAFEGERAEKPSHAFAEAANLHEARANGEKQTRTDQEND